MYHNHQREATHNTIDFLISRYPGIFWLHLILFNNCDNLFSAMYILSLIDTNFVFGSIMLPAVHYILPLWRLLHNIIIFITKDDRWLSSPEWQYPMYIIVCFKKCWNTVKDLCTLQLIYFIFCRFKAEGIIDASPETCFKHCNPKPNTSRALWDSSIKAMEMVKAIQLNQYPVSCVTFFISLDRNPHSMCLFVHETFWSLAGHAALAYHIIRQWKCIWLWMTMHSLFFAFICMVWCPFGLHKSFLLLYQCRFISHHYIDFST